jgi:hypothetical protein
MGVTGINRGEYGIYHRIPEYGLTEIISDIHMPELIQFGEDIIKIGEIKLGNFIHITGFNVTVKMQYTGLYVSYVAKILSIFLKQGRKIAALCAQQAVHDIKSISIHCNYINKNIYRVELIARFWKTYIKILIFFDE